MSFSDVFVTNTHFESLGKFDLLKTVERLQSLEVIAEQNTNNRSVMATARDVPPAGPAPSSNLIDRPLKTLFVRNIAEEVTKDDIIDLFGLHKTDFMKAHTRIGIVHGKDQKTAIVEVLEEVYDQLLKLSGIKFKNRDIILSATQDPSQDTTAPNAQEVEEETVDEESAIEYLEIDTRLPEWSFNQVTDLEVARALDIEYGDDPTKSVEDIGRYKKSLKGIFRIDSNDYERYKDQVLTIRDKEFAFIPKFRRPNKSTSKFFPADSSDPRRKRGTLITIYRAYRMEHRQIRNECFDDCFREMGIEVIKTTLPQFRKDTTVLNNNRYLVVQKLDDEAELKKKIGSFITVEGVKFYMVYTGMEKWCYECSRVHGYHCPTRARNDFLQKLRKGRTGKRKLYSDSIARHTNVPALTTDVACMSGGGIGQLINSISYDEKHEEVVILGGTNEIVYTRDPSEFVFTIDKSLEKLRKLAEEVTTSFVLPCVPLVTPEMKAKADYLEEEVRKVDKVKIIKLQDIQQEGIHPTEVGTCSMIQQLHQAFNEEIIVDGAEEGDLTTRKYGKVQAIYKVGAEVVTITIIRRSGVPNAKTEHQNRILKGFYSFSKLQRRKCSRK